jgi:hypothetical protein
MQSPGFFEGLSQMGLGNFNDIVANAVECAGGALDLSVPSLENGNTDGNGLPRCFYQFDVVQLD